MKRTLLAACLVLAALPVFALNQEALGKAMEGSVLAIEHSLWLDPFSAKNAEYWRKYERETGKKIIGTDYAYLLRSGFFVTEEGLFLSDSSAFKPDIPELARAAVQRRFEADLDKSSLTPTEKIALRAEFQAIAANAKPAIKVFLGSEDLGSYEIVSESVSGAEGAVLAKVARKGCRPLRLCASDLAPKREAVAAGFSLAAPSGTRALSLKAGTITAAKAPLIVQSYAVEDGFIGGPLVDGKGDAAGLIRANQSSAGAGMCFATVASELKKFMAGAIDPETVAWNGHLPGLLGAGGTLPLNAAGEIESAATALVDAGPDATIYLDGVEAGKGRSELTFTNPLSDLLLSFPSGAEYAAKVRMRPYIRGPSSLEPDIDELPSPVSLRSKPSGARVWLDGKFMGTTPLESELLPGDYRLQLSRDGSWYPESTLTVAAGKKAEWDSAGEAAWEVAVLGAPEGKGSALRFSSDRGSFTPPRDAKIYLPAGKWSLAVEGAPSLARISIPISMKNAPQAIDLAAYAKMAKLRVKGLAGQEKIWVDGKIWAAPRSEYLDLAVGTHSLFIWEKGLEALDVKEINVRADGSSFVVFPRLKSHGKKGGQYFGIALGTGIGGAALLILGGAGLMSATAAVDDAQAGGGAGTYSEGGQTDGGKGLALLCFGAGCCLEIASVITGSRSASEFAAQKKEAERIDWLERTNE